MATIMEKDVLIEGIAQALGYLRGTDNTLDHERLLEMRDCIYSSKPEELDYRTMMDEIMFILKKVR